MKNQASPSTVFDTLICGGMVYDGTGENPKKVDVGIQNDRITAVGTLKTAKAKTLVNAEGLAVTPGFINMFSRAEASLLIDGRSQGDIRQGVTTQIFGETSQGPFNEGTKKRLLAAQGDIKYDIPWSTLFEYLVYLEKRGVSQNFASFIGLATIREYVIGLENKKPTAKQLEQMRELVHREMADGALGVTSALIFPPAVYATTEEIIELCKVATKYQGKYTSHIRSEGDQFLEGIEELIRISREAEIPAEIYHLKASGEANWPKMDRAIAMIEAARHEGLKIIANMYPYIAGATGLDTCIPPWALDGGHEALFKRLQDPIIRKKICDEIRAPTSSWENFYQLVGSPDRILLIGLKTSRLKPFAGKTLAEVAKIRKQDPVDTLLDLILEDRSRVITVYFTMSEENLKKGLQRPWVSICSDAPSMAPEEIFLKNSTHPRAYGSFARFLGKYVREEKLISLSEAIQRLSGLPATNLGLDHRGFLKEGMFADVVVFDPKTITDHATYENPHQYSTGVKDVFVNGVQVLKDGDHTGAKPGRALWGPGKKK